MTVQDVDFTDMLWSVVCRAGSYEELRDALNLTLVTMVQQDIRPFIYSGLSDFLMHESSPTPLFYFIMQMCICTHYTVRYRYGIL